MLPDMICIGIILFFVCAMAVSCKDSRRWTNADRLACLYDIYRDHNETCDELRARVYAYRNEALIAFDKEFRKVGELTWTG